MAPNYLLLGLMLLLSPCAQDVRALKLDQVNLDDPVAVQEIRDRAADKDRGAFNSYVHQHHTASKKFCGRSLRRLDGNLPSALGEAIELTLARDAEHLAALEASKKPMSAVEVAAQRWGDLISDRDALFDAHGFLREEHGPSAERLPEWQSTSQRLADIDSRLIELKPQVFGSD